MNAKKHESAGTGPVHFYRTTDAFGEFSNFKGGYPITLKGKSWRTTEHYFQAQKFAGHPDEEELRLMPSPMAVARAGRNRKRPFRKDWESVKLPVMRDALRAKFTQHDELRNLLLGTGDRKLVEHTANDRYWGDGGDGTGQNMLGRMLTELRTELQTEDK